MFIEPGPKTDAKICPTSIVRRPCRRNAQTPVLVLLSLLRLDVPAYTSAFAAARLYCAWSNW